MKVPKFSKALRSGFTLVELLVVISIIAVLAGVAMPAMTGVIERGQQTKVISDARQIYLALKMYAGDNDGLFINNSGAMDNANQAFRELLVEGRYLTTEKIFNVAKSKWCQGTTNKPLENTANITAADADKLMQEGVNHFGFVGGLNDASTPSYPLIVDGPTSQSTAQEFSYSTNEGLKGGLWKGKVTIVVFVDGSAKSEKTYSDGNNIVKTLRPKSSTGEANKNLIQVDTDWLAGTKLLLPLNPTGS